MSAVAPDGCIDPRELADIARACRITGQSKSYIFKHKSPGVLPQFPASFPIGGRMFWRVADLYAWNEERYLEAANGKA